MSGVASAPGIEPGVAGVARQLERERQRRRRGPRILLRRQAGAWASAGRQVILQPHLQRAVAHVMRVRQRRRGAAWPQAQAAVAHADQRPASTGGAPGASWRVLTADVLREAVAHQHHLPLHALAITRERERLHHAAQDLPHADLTPRRERATAHQPGACRLAIWLRPWFRRQVRTQLRTDGGTRHRQAVCGRLAGMYPRAHPRRASRP